MDPYEELGVRKNASESTIRKAWRKKAMSHHPDRGGDRAAFEQAQRAFRCLSDASKRAEYDRTAQMPSDAPDDTAAALMGVLNTVLEEVVAGLLKTGSKPADHDLAALMRESVQKRLDGVAANVKALEEAAKVLEGLLGRFTAEDGSEFDDLIRHQKKNVEDTLAQFTKGKVLHEAALAYLKKFRFRRDVARVQDWNCTVTMNGTTFPGRWG
jgi:curved DNA-binding protein CbpA